MEKKDYEYIDPEQRQWFQTCDPEVFSHKKPLYLYLKKAIASEGFDVDVPPKATLCGLIHPASTSCERVVAAANFGIQEFNRLKGAELKLRQIIRVNTILVSGVLYYLTLECWDSRFYEAKVYIPFTDDEERSLRVFRPAKFYTSSGGGGSSGSSTSEDSLLKASAVREELGP